MELVNPAIFWIMRSSFGLREILLNYRYYYKEYGGDVGWAFIEEYGYKELIEAILRDQESNDEDSTKQKVQYSMTSAELFFLGKCFTYHFCGIFQL